METNLTVLELDRVLTLVALEARTAPGRQAVLERRPSPSAEACERGQAELWEMVRFYLKEGALPLAGIDDVAPLLKHEVMELGESWRVVRAARATQAIRETLRRSRDDYPRLASVADGIADLNALLSAVGRYFSRDGTLREEASATLRSIRTRIHAKRQAIHKSLVDLMGQHADSVQESIVTLRNDRYCIPVRTERRSDLPGILHERSGSGSSLFIEPIGVVEMNNDLADLLIEEREEIVRLTRFISQQLQDVAPEIETSIDVSGGIDAIQACAVFAGTVRGARPLFSRDGELRLINARHPLIDERLIDARRAAFGESEAGERVVPTSLHVDRETPALLVSGPNAGGKTVALKTAGLLVAMAMSGLPVPADDGTTIPIVDRVHVLIGDDQDLLGHLSTFSAYLVRLKRVLENAEPRSLVLLDELGSGTDPEEGAALGAAAIEHIIAAGALLIVTTHLSAIKTFAIRDTHIGNASMEFDAASGRPTYRLIAGIPGRSRAIDVAAMIGLPSPVIAAARARLGDEHGRIDELLAELQKKTTEIANELDAARESRVAMEAAVAEAQKRADELAVQKKRLAEKLREDLDRVRDDVARNLHAELKRLREADRSTRDRTREKELLQVITRPAEEHVAALPLESREPRVGDKVEHRRLKIVGELLSVDGTRATISVAGKRMHSDFADLRVVAGGTRTAGSEKPRRAFVDAGEEPEVAGELNLIGLRVDDALDQSDKFLDQSLLAGRGAVRLIHGHGTGALKKALREYLKKHRGVRSFRAGNEREGGDGATVAILDV